MPSETATIDIITKCDFIGLSRKSGHFKETAIELRRRVMDHHALETRATCQECCLSLVTGLIIVMAAATKISVNHIKILVLNCAPFHLYQPW
ncbi:hypothetical protein ISN44_As10g021140 [Arabidopsis suecica]|uniref:Uncharacterized protein n=1 Tax=Arabidopsis suecica TaxID=45249 RepID=A0A8T1ZZJ7_ARASU|nr:hypothetical protein ISN44_As10g021140 [Arabidopsis suecica]KAG7565421.1 hypothetical protein ISN44_As10g021140 [Arabidopsis suecica]